LRVKDKGLHKILVRGVNWIGDAVMSIPALRGLRRGFPDSSISLLVRPPVAPLFSKDPAIDDIILYDDSYRGTAGRYRLSRLLRERRFSTAFLLQNAFDAALLSFLAGIPERIGYNRDSRGFLLTRPVPFKGEDRKIHHIEYYLNLLRSVGVPAGTTAPWVFQTLEDRLEGRKLLSDLSQPVLGINPGAAYGSAKRWLPERFSEVARWFIEDTGGSVVIVGSRQEAMTAHTIEISVRSGLGGSRRDPDGSPVLNLAGKTSVGTLISVISECDIFLSNDSGPMHIAYAVGAPLVALFGSTNPALTGPPGEGSEVIRSDALSCSPCFDRTCLPGHLRCMYGITSDEVFFALKRMVPARPAVFLDRDGTLCRDASYLSSWDRFELLPGVENLQALKNRGFALVGVSNQSGIARGLVDEGFVREVNSLFVDRYGFDDFSYCPHDPGDHCACRKPETGLMVGARKRHRIDLKRSFVIGDKDADMLLARNLGSRGILVKTGQQQDSPHADAVVNGLQEAIEYILDRSDTQPQCPSN
jgi:heptosyltransferase-2